MLETIFTLVDALVGFSLRASAEAGPAAFAVGKPHFDALIFSGSFGYGVSAVLIGWPSRDGAAVGPRELSRALAVVGALLVAAAGAGAWGAALGQSIGIGITVLTVLFTLLAGWNVLARSG